MGKGARLEIEVRPAEREPVFLALARAVVEEIERGRLRPGDPLPGTRALGRTLGLNRNTVDAAYHELAMQGWLAATPSRGTAVAAALPERIERAPPASPAVPAASPPPERETLRLCDGSPDVRLLPAAALAQAFRRALTGPAAGAGGRYGDPRGSPALREALSAYLREERGLAAVADAIFVARGSQMGLFLAAAAIAGPGEVIAVERPGYPLAWAAFRQAGADVVGVPVDAGGLDVDALEALAARTRALRAVYVTPHHQYPTTVTLGAARRARLLEVARQHDLAVIEDDYDNDYRFDGRPILPLAARPDGATVVYLGSLSKLLAPGIRLGTVVAPPAILAAMATRREALDRQGDLPLERAVAELLADGTIRRHARKARRVYGGRRDHFAGLLTRHLGDAAEFTLPPGGLAIWLRLRPGLSADRWAAEAARRGLDLLPGRAFDPDATRPPEAFRLGFAALDEREQTRAVALLAATRPDR